jgi:hypothetical protein
MRRLLAGALALALLPACFGPDPNLTESGKGKPLVTVEFPASASAGSVQTATLTVENPGPGDMGSVVVAFASVGVPAASGPLPGELVPVTTTAENPAITAVTPEPDNVSDDGVVYVFGGLEEGARMEISFSIRVPAERGPAANSVSVYAGEEADRIRGVRLETVVTG